MNYIKYYRMWLPDIMDPEGGIWSYMGMTEDKLLWQLNFAYPDKEEPNTLEEYIEWGYKVEEL